MDVLVAAGGGAVGAACAGGYFAYRWVRRRRAYSHAALFRQLCRVHKLDRNARGLLRRVAAGFRMAQPGRLFIDPKWLDAAAGAAALPKKDLRALRERLFGPPAGDKTPKA